MEAFRIPNGTGITVNGWTGLVVSQDGPRVLMTLPGGKFGYVDRGRIDKVRGRYVIFGGLDERHGDEVAS